MKKFFTILLSLILIMIQIPTNTLAENSNNTSDILIVETDTGGVVEKGEFPLSLSLENISDKSLSNVRVKILSSSSFSPAGKVITDPIDIDEGDTEKTEEIPLYYSGGNDTTLNLNITYEKNGEPESKSMSITIPIVPDSQKEGDNTPVDTTKYKPKLSIVNNRMPIGQAGGVVSIPLTIKNTSNYLAKNISISPEFVGEDNPFSIEDLSFSKNISKISANKSAYTKLKLSIDPSAKEKNYSIKLNYQYTNSYGDEQTSSDIIYVKVVNKNVPPRLVIDKLDISTKKIGPGSDVKVGFNIENKGTLDAKDIKFSIDGLADDGFIVTNGSNTQYTKKIGGEYKGYVTFNLKASNKITRGSHGLDLKMSYSDSKGQTYEDSQKFYLSVGGKQGINSNVVIENITYPDGTVRPGKDFTVGFDLKNTGKLDATNIKVTVQSPDPAVIPKTASIKKINTLSPDKSQKLSFVFSPTQDATTKNYPINITVEYEDELNAGKEDKYVVTQYIGVYVEKPGDGDKGKPKLIIDKYNFKPSIAKAGEKFTMNLSFFNTNKSKGVNNIKIFLTADEKTEKTGGNVFTPVGSSNTFYIDSIPPKARVHKTITMSTVPDAKAKTYTITANFEYEDGDGNEYKATELIGIPVVQQSELQIGEINIPPQTFVGQPVPVMVEFYNTGKVTLSNLMVKLDGDFQTENGSYFVGNFESGSSDSFDGNIIPSKTGELKGNLIFSYDDSAGEHKEIKKELKMNVEEAPPMEPNPEDMPPEGQEKGFKKLVKSKAFWIVTIIIIAAIIAFVIWRKKKKKKEGMAFDE